MNADDIKIFQKHVKNGCVGHVERKGEKKNMLLETKTTFGNMTDGILIWSVT